MQPRTTVGNDTSPCKTIYGKTTIFRLQQKIQEGSLEVSNESVQGDRGERQKKRKTNVQKETMEENGEREEQKNEENWMVQKGRI